MNENNINEEKNIYYYDENISFRKCTLANETKSYFGNCTNFYKKRDFFSLFTYSEKFCCNQNGIHFHCTKHPTIELEDEEDENNKNFFRCPKCNNKIEIKSRELLLGKCQKKYNIKSLSDFKFIRLDDWYIPETKKKIKTDSDYWISTEVKKDKNQDTIIVIYVGLKDSKDKVQYFIKPEKLQMAHDYKDLDPATILSKIEVTLKDRILSENFKID